MIRHSCSFLQLPRELVLWSAAPDVFVGDVATVPSRGVPGRGRAVERTS